MEVPKSYLDTLYFIVDCYFVFIKAGLPAQLLPDSPINTQSNQLTSWTQTPFADEKEEDSSGETFSLDFDL
ncbi:hypothetical protein [Nostoc sp. 'Peltigera membranacea cyanobiont' 213]|uniref:hypothetical protein n=1 Tax=Nostoc sp. 'Peltigera membranacea cyanobiont' 213 TaxID=2014530 RepID=UPI00167C7672|nr:hypothetical protein [Nostoc sp. 'Peltigera membranacea cyanobiont' 213]